MDIWKLASDLISGHVRRTEHMAAVLRGTARTHYKCGIEDAIRSLQDASINDSMIAGLEFPPQATITGPLAVQPSHAAEDVK